MIPASFFGSDLNFFTGGFHPFAAESATEPLSSGVKTYRGQVYIVYGTYIWDVHCPPTAQDSNLGCVCVRGTT